MSTIVVTSRNCDATLAAHPIVVMDFWAPWCGPCRQFSPIFTAVSAEFPDVVFATVDVDSCPDLVGRYNVRGVPTVLVFRDGHPVHAASSAMTAVALRALVTRLSA